MFLTLCALFTTTSESSAVTIFSDSFEYTDSPENHDWVFTTPSTNMWTTTDESYEGLRSIYVGNTGQMSHFLGDIPANSVDTVSMWFYDNMNFGTNWDAGGWLHFNNGSSAAALTYYNGSNYWYFTTEGDTQTTIQRTLGWHEFLWDLTVPDTVTMYIDGALAGSYSESISTVLSVTLVVGEVPYEYFDKVEVFGSQAVPEPATMLLLGIGLAGLAGTAVRRRLKKIKQ